jgi:hypothetical protein
MNSSPHIDVDSLAAFDVHVHLESSDDRTATDDAAKEYFGDSGAARDASALAEYYRSRKIAFVMSAWTKANRKEACLQRGGNSVCRTEFRRGHSICKH